MKNTRAFVNLTLATLLSLGLCVLMGRIIMIGEAAPPIRFLSAPGSPALLPTHNTHTAPITATLSIAYDEAIDPTTVSTRTFVVFAEQTGTLRRTYGVNGGTITLTPTHPLKPGERVHVSATTGTLSLVDGQGPNTPTVWQFRAAVTKGAGIFIDSEQRLGFRSTTALALGDIDGDGDIDAFVGNNGEANRVWLNDGNATFTDSGQSLGTAATYAVALGDFDGDGDLDAFTGNFNQPNMVWVNDGSGTFTDSGLALGSGQTDAVAIGDVDGDGDLDAFVGELGWPNSVWLNDGNGTFTDSGQTLGSDLTSDVVLGDLDGDGDLDAFIGNYDEANRVWLNDGSGTFTNNGQSLGAAATDAVALGDVDGDGDLDAFVGNYGEANRVWLNDGSGIFTNNGQSLGAAATKAVAMGDLDGDGDLDVFSGNHDWESNRVWINDGSGIFTDSGQGLDNGRTHAVALGDLDGEGDLDAFVGNYYDEANLVWINGLRDLVIDRFTVSPTYLDGGQSLSVTMTIGNQGVEDISTAFSTAVYADRVPSPCDGGTGSWDSQVTPALAAGESITLSFTHSGFPVSGRHRIYALVDTTCATDQVTDNNTVLPRTVWVDPFTVTATVPPVNDLAIARDGMISATFSTDIDNATVNTRTFTVRGQQTGIYKGTYTFGSAIFDAAENFKPGEEIVVNLSDQIYALDGSVLVPYAWQLRTAVMNGTGVFSDSFQRLGSANTHAIVLGDLDGDGDLDLFEGTDWDNRIWLNENNGTFTDSNQALGNSYTYDLALGDLDSDGDLDAFVSNAGEGNRVWLNDGSGTFTDSGQILGSAYSFAVALGDVDGDGDLDAFIGNYGEGNRIWLNDGKGTFTDSGQILESARTRDVALGDVDGDGDLDAIEGNYSEGNRIWLNDGAGIFNNSGQLLGNFQTKAVALRDVDDDGDLDAFIGNDGEGNRIWLNDGNGVFIDTGQPLGSAYSTSVSLGDVDSDGDLDTFVGNDDQHNSLWLNDGSGIFSDSGLALDSIRTTSVALGDVDGDGDLDALIANSREGEPNFVWLNNKNAPLAEDDRLAAPPNSADNVLNVLANDRDPDGDNLTILAVGIPREGNATTDGATITYTPDTGFNGLDVFSYTISDPGFLTDTATITVTVGAGTPPIAQDDVGTTNEDIPVPLHVLVNDIDPEGQTLVLADVGAPSKGTTIIEGNQIRYTPSIDFNGVDTFTYVASDGWLTDTARVTVTVNPVEDAPTIDVIGNQTVAEDANPQTLSLSSITSGADDEFQTLTVTATSHQPALVPHPIVTYTSPSTSGTLCFQPLPNQFGTAHITVQVSDGISQTVEAFSVIVTEVNDPPTLDPIAEQSILEDAPEQTVDISGIDDGPGNEGQNGSLTVSAVSDNIALIPDPTIDYNAARYWEAHLRFAPVADQYGEAHIHVTVTDPGGLDAMETFTVTVEPVNDPPTLDSIPALFIDEDTHARRIDLTGIDAGAANESQTLIITAASSDTVLLPHPTRNYTSPNATGSLTLTPSADRFGATTISVIVSDGLSLTAQTFSVTVNPVNDPPTLDAIPDLLLEQGGHAETVALSSITAGPYESQPLTVTAAVIDPSLVPTITVAYTSPSDTGNLHLMPGATDFGVTTIAVTVTDGLIETPRIFATTVNPLFRFFSANPGNGGAITHTGPIKATYTRQVANSTVGPHTVNVYGEQTGRYTGSLAVGSLPYDTFTFSSIAFTPTNPFKPGERVQVTLGQGIQSTDGGAIAAPHTWQFRAATSSGLGVFDVSELYDVSSISPFKLSESYQPQSVLDSQAVALGDLDGDGDLDAYVVRNSARSTVWFNNGGGAFTDRGLDLENARSWAVALGDLDRDGDLDALVGNYGGPDTLWFNDGTGAFTKSPQTLDSGDTYAVALGDVDGDGDLDAVTGSDLGQANRLWINDGTGRFILSDQYLGYWDTRALALGDMDNDGDLDILLGNSNGEANRLWFNDGRGRFKDSDQELGAAQTYAVALGDLDGDHDLDLFVGNLEGEPDEVWFNDGSGTLMSSGQQLGHWATWSLDLGDIDADGDLDAVTGQVHWGLSGSKKNRVWVNDGSGHFTTNQQLGEWDSLSIALGDVEGDGDLDVFVGNSNGLNQPNVIYRNRSLLALITAKQGGILSYGDPEVGDMVIRIPPRAVQVPTEIRLTNDATRASTQRVEEQTPVLDFALRAYQQNEEVPDLTFSVPMTITIHYSDVGLGDVDEGTLELLAWDGTTWSAKGITITNRDVMRNKLVVQTTRPMEYVLRGRAIYHTYLPLTMRAHVGARTSTIETRGRVTRMGWAR